MKSKHVYLCGIIVLSIIIGLSFGSCKEFGIPDYTLTITIAEGINGTPSEGTHVHKELEAIEYNYIPDNEDLTVEVLVNGGRWAPSGVFTMFTHISVEVGLFDIRGTWDVNFSQPTDSEEDDLEFKITIIGDDLLAGSFSDDRGEGYEGLWTIAGNVVTITYSNWQNYILTGTIPQMTGGWTGENKSSTWSAVR
jgi:hypothetical protein